MNSKNIGFFLRKFELSLKLRLKSNANLYFIFNCNIFLFGIAKKNQTLYHNSPPTSSHESYSK